MAAAASTHPPAPSSTSSFYFHYLPLCQIFCVFCVLLCSFSFSKSFVFLVFFCVNCVPLFFFVPLGSWALLVFVTLPQKSDLIVELSLTGQ